MGISVEGQKCPICDAYLFDNDDLVFCPECGAPHHRDCYAVLGHCAYEDKHGTDEGYKPAQREEKIQKEADEEAKDIKDICRFCGEKLQQNENFCHKCGRPKTVGQPPFGAAVIIDPMGGVSPDDTIDGVPVGEIKSYVANNTQRYLPRFKAMSENKKKSWNWAAFLVPHVWFFYRKMYLTGILFTVLLIAASLFLLPLSAIISTFPQEATASTTLLARYLAENISSIEALPIYLAVCGSILELVIRIVAGFTGDKIYKKSVFSGIKKVKDAKEESDIPLELALTKSGGVNTFLGFISLFSFNLILEWIGAIYIIL